MLVLGAEGKDSSPVPELMTSSGFIHSLSNAGVPVTKLFLDQYTNRGLFLTPALLGEIKKEFPFFIPVFSRHLLQPSYRVKPIISVRDSVVFCCNCLKFSFNCPVCFYNNYTMCEYPFRDFSTVVQDWHRIVYYPGVDYATDYSVSSVPYGLSLLTTYSLQNDNSNVFFARIRPRYSCRPRLIAFNDTIPYSALNRCTVVIALAEPCPNSTFSSIDLECDWSNVYESPLDSVHKVCSSTVYNPGFTSFYTTSEEGLCNNQHYDVEIPFLTDFYRNITDTRFIFVPQFLGRSRDKYYFQIPDFSQMTFLNTRNNDEYLSSLWNDTVIQQDIICTRNRLHSDLRYFNGSPSWLGHILINLPCSAYYPYDNVSHVCKEAITYPFPYCRDSAFSERSVNYIKYFVHAQTNDPIFNVTCEQLTELGKCVFSKASTEFTDNFLNGFSDILNITFSNFTFVFTDFMNHTLYSVTDYFFTNMGMNDTKVHFHSVRNSSHLVGNWISGIFGVLIEPFFDVFIKNVLSAFIPPLFDALINVVDVLADLLITLASKISEFIFHVASALVELFVILLNLFMGILILLESKILLFEYALLFLFILYRVINNVPFALVILCVTAVIFGVIRKSPSFLLPIVNHSFTIFSLADYNVSSFDYSYV